MKILVTGGCGFIGSNFIRYSLQSYPNDTLINVDKLTYAGNVENLSDLSQSPHYHFIRGDITDGPRMEELIHKGVDAIINFAAESHVDRSIEDPSAFMKTNVFGTFVLLEAIRKVFPKQRIRFLHISTDEVYGSLGETGAFTEETSLVPNSPYSASKTAADMMVRAYHHTYGLPTVITNCSNNYGPYQFPEKLIPVVIQDAATNEVLMLGYMNREAWEETLRAKRVTFWSRSRKKLWLKGETSGHFQEVREIWLDCDGDTLLIKVDQIGRAACHTGFQSCFHHRHEEGEWKVSGKRIFDPKEVYGK